MHSDLKSKSINGVAWNFIGKIATHVVTFIVSIFLARLLSLEDFGLVAMAMVFISIAQVFMDFGLTTALIQKKNPTEIQVNTIFYVNMILAVILMSLTMAGAGFIERFYNNPEVGSIARIVAFLFLIYGLNGVQRAILTKELKIKTLTLSNLSGAFVQGVSGILLALNDYGAWSLVYSNLLGSVTASIFLWFQSSWRPKFMFRLSEIKELFNFGYKMFFVRLLDTIYVKLDELIIGKMFSADTLGSYNRAKSFNHMIVSYTSDSLSGVFFPVISHLQDDIERVKNVVKKSLETVSFLVFGITGLLYLDAESLIVLLFSEKWEISVEYFKILAFAAYGFPVSVILVNVLMGLGHSGAFLKLDIWKKAVGLSGMAIGFLWGIYGYLWALVMVNIIAVTLNMWFVGRFIQLNLQTQWTILLKYAIQAFVCALIVWLLNQYLSHNLWLFLVVNTIVFSSLYFLTNLLLKTNGYLYVKELFVSKIYKRFLSAKKN